MHFSALSSIVFALLCSQLTLALITLQTIRNLTELTDDCRTRITGTTIEGQVEIDEMARVLGGVGRGQMVMGSGDEDGDEVEVVSFFCGG